jgi:hypothetical protein
MKYGVLVKVVCEAISEARMGLHNAFSFRNKFGTVLIYLPRQILIVQN